MLGMIGNAGVCLVMLRYAWVCLVMLGYYLVFWVGLGTLGYDWDAMDFFAMLYRTRQNKLVYRKNVVWKSY